MISVLRDAAWLTPTRARAYATLLLGFGLLLLAGIYAHIVLPAWSDAAHRPIASDFDAFWAGARLALHGQAASVYTPAAVKIAEAEGAQTLPGQWFVYLYPPTFLLACLPLGLLPYLLALPAFLGLTYAALFAALRRILPPAWPGLAIAASPILLLNAAIGQNGFASAACFGGALIWLDKRPVLAGAALGLLAAKPHLAICVPIGLLAARRWHALAACAAVAASIVALSWAVLGTATWQAFLAQGPMMGAMLRDPDIWSKLASLYGAARILHAPAPAAAAIQAAGALAAIVCVIAVASRRPGGAAEIATIAIAGLLCTPYIWDYDLAVLTVPLAWAAARAGAQGWRAWEKTCLLAIYLVTAFIRPIGLATSLPLAPALLAGLLCIVATRTGAAAS